MEYEFKQHFNYCGASLTAVRTLDDAVDPIVKSVGPQQRAMLQAGKGLERERTMMLHTTIQHTHL